MNADLVLQDFHVVTMKPGAAPYGLIRHGTVVVHNGLIVWTGTTPEFESSIKPKLATSEPVRVIQGEGRHLSPGLVDCHTHIVWGGSRADEWEMRLTGVSYEEIAR